MIRRSCFLSLPAVFLFACLAQSAMAQKPAVRSRGAAAAVKADGAIGDWAGTATVLDPRSGIEFSFQNDGRKLWILAVVKDPGTLESLESTGMTVLAGPAKGKKPARGVLFLVRRIPAESYIYWRESQGKLLSDAEKEKIREAGPQDDTFAFAVGARGSTQGPLRNQSRGGPAGIRILRRAGRGGLRVRDPARCPRPRPRRPGRPARREPPARRSPGAAPRRRSSAPSPPA